jgi:hypothetical protein
LAGHHSISHRPACRSASRNSKAFRVAHVPAQLFHDIDRKRRKREGRARTYAALKLSVHIGNLFSGSNSGQAGCSTSGYSDDYSSEWRSNRCGRAMILTKEATREQPPSSPRTPFLYNYRVADYPPGKPLSRSTCSDFLDGLRNNATCLARRMDALLNLRPTPAPWTARAILPLAAEGSSRNGSWRAASRANVVT